MLTDYSQERIAEQYRESKTQPWRSQIETYSFLKLIGDVSGQKVLDVACGEGYFTRILGQSGVSKVVGIDTSDRMIALAREQEERQPLGIEYRVEDARSAVPQQDFDMAVAAYLLDYASDRTELARMCQGVASRVKPGSRFVTVTSNPGLESFHPIPNYKKYGFEVILAELEPDGAPLQFKFDLSDSSLTLDTYHMSADSYESELNAAGFRHFKLHTPELDPSVDVHEVDYWDDFLNYPPIALIDCVKM
ncbi:class I SAM-dependent methyltransferase [Rhodococcus sp. NPDC049939]|uniref:class I SAM-dependent methyltransferase n=1 Tax=Rhodococcus sp. NPDC049939 TaxID=3155511 RepID=UPI0033F7FB7F